MSEDPSLHVAAREFEIVPEADVVTDVRHGGRAVEIAGGLKTTVFFFGDGEERLCLVTTHFGPSFPVNLSRLLRETLAADLEIPVSRVLLFTSHNHTSVALAANGVLAYNAYAKPIPEVDLLPAGEIFLEKLRHAAKALPPSLEPVTVWWAEGRESRITYYRKGRRDDGTTYLMREEDREKLGPDFRGDVDEQAPLVVFRNGDGKAVAALAQFTGHPVTAFHPERTVVFGEWPQVACDRIAEQLDGAPVGFLQGCAGDVSSKEMFVGGVERSREFGEWLSDSYLAALENLRPSRRVGLAAELQTVGVPLGPLPPLDCLEAELAEMDDFIRRAEAGDEDTLLCAGQNFPTGLSPKYRAWLVSLIRPWNEWAIDCHDAGKADTIPDTLDLEIAAIRLGDVGFGGLPCEPFQNIGRRLRAGSTLPLTIPCGYMNVNHGYIADAANTGDNEYMSAHHRYTRFRAPLRPPAGDLLADAAVEILNRFASRDA